MRCFISIPVPEHIADALMNLQDGVRNARWVPADDMHVTLAFLGNCEPNELRELDAVLADISMDTLTLTPVGAGSFGGAKPSSLHVGIAEVDPLERLHRKILRAADAAGIAVERRKYRPHVTLARCGGGVAPMEAHEWVRRRARYHGPAFQADGFELFRSDLHQRGSVYTSLVRYGAPAVRADP